MKIVIIGGTGLIGSRLVDILRQRGHDASAASPNSGECLDEVLVRADVVVDVANSPSFTDDAVLDFFTTSVRNLLAAAAKAGVKHHGALSVVGTDRLAESGYFRGEIAQEKLIRESGLPYTIVHSTEFFEFLGGIVASAAAGDAIHLSPDCIHVICRTTPERARLARHLVAHGDDEIHCRRGRGRELIPGFVAQVARGVGDGLNLLDCIWMDSTGRMTAGAGCAEAPRVGAVRQGFGDNDARRTAVHRNRTHLLAHDTRRFQACSLPTRSSSIFIRTRSFLSSSSGSAKNASTRARRMR